MGSGVNPSSVVVILDNKPVSGCTASATGISCYVTKLGNGTHNVQVNVSDSAGNTGWANGAFDVCAGGLVLPATLEKTGCPVWRQL